MEVNFDIRSIEVLKRLLAQSKLANQSLKDIEPAAMRAISYPDMRAVYSTLILIGDLHAMGLEFQRAFDQTNNRAFRVKGMASHRLVHDAFAMQWGRASMQLYSYLKETYYDVSTDVTKNIETFYDALVNPQLYVPNEPTIRLDLNTMPPEAAERMQALMLEFMEEGIIASPIAMETDEDRADRLSREETPGYCPELNCTPDEAQEALDRSRAADKADRGAELDEMRASINGIPIGYEVWDESSEMPILTDEEMQQLMERLDAALDKNGELPFPRHHGKGLPLTGSEGPNKPPAIPPKGFIHEALKTLITGIADATADELDRLLNDPEIDRIVSMSDSEFEIFVLKDIPLAVSEYKIKQEMLALGTDPDNLDWKDTIETHPDYLKAKRICFQKEHEKALKDKRQARTFLKKTLPWLRGFLGGYKE